MYCAKIIYPKSEESFFDFDHYFKVHLPLALSSIKPYAEVVKVEVDKGVGGMVGEEDMPYHCICSVFFNNSDGIDGFRRLFATPEDGQPVADDIPNYTNSRVEFQFSQTLEHN
ncbi:MAG: EthD family reductase [Gammaproteobacteria bacterium]|nr:EthD family reductase [Gammaproteobacteria bacterium]